MKTPAVRTAYFPRLRECGRECRRLDEQCLAGALATGAVKQDSVAIRFPDRGEFDAAWAMHAKEDAARLFAPDQDSFRYAKGRWFEFILIANRVVDIGSEVVQIVDLERLSRHFLAQSPRGWMKSQRDRKTLPVGKDRQFAVGVSVKYRLASGLI